MTRHHYDVAVAGVHRAERRLADAGFPDVIGLDDCDLSASAFDEATHFWDLPTCRVRIVITDQIRCGRENVAPYLGVAVHGAPNYFMVTGTGGAADAQLDYIVRCLELMWSTGSTRIEVLFSTQRLAAMRSQARSVTADKPDPTAFDLSSHTGVADGIYDGPARIRVGDDDHRVRVRLSGRLDPIDGRYHWQGTVFEANGVCVGPAALMIDERTADCRITERTSQGGFSVVGIGAPPYSLSDVDIVVPSR